MTQSITWVVVEQKLPGGRSRLISKHESQKEAEAASARRNSGRAATLRRLYSPGASGTADGGHQAPTTST
jgi:hypothetical protein